MNTAPIRPLPIVALSLWLCACPKVPELDFGPSGPLTDPAQVLARLSQAEAAVHSVEGDGRISFKGPQGGGTVSALIAASEDGHVHIELLDFFGKPQAVLVTDGERFGLYQGQENRYYQGPATPENLARLLPMAVRPAELASLLLGRTTRQAFDRAGVDVDRARGGYRVSLYLGGAAQWVWVHPVHFRALGSESSPPDVALAFDDFRQEPQAAFPKSLRWREGQTEVELHYGDFTLNSTLDPDLFVPRPPPNVPVVDVGTPSIGM